MHIEYSLHFRGDKAEWRCRRCRATRSIRTGSRFANSNLSIGQQIHLMIDFLATAKGCAVAKAWDISPRTVYAHWGDYRSWMANSIRQGLPDWRFDSCMFTMMKPLLCVFGMSMMEHSTPKSC